MIKIKLIKSHSYSELEDEVNNFLQGKIPLEVNIQEGPSLEYLASILYKEINSQDLNRSISGFMPKVETVLLKQNENPQTPFDRMSIGLSPSKED